MSNNLENYVYVVVCKRKYEIYRLDSHNKNTLDADKIVNTEIPRVNFRNIYKYKEDRNDLNLL